MQIVERVVLPQTTSPVNYSKQIEVKMNINLENTVRCSRGHMQSSRCSSGRMRGFRHCSGHVRGSVCRVGRVRASTSPSRTSTSFPATRGLSCSALSERREKSEAATDIINQPSQNISSPQYLLTSKLFGQNVFKLLSLATLCCLFTNIHSEMFEESNLDYLK